MAPQNVVSAALEKEIVLNDSSSTSSDTFDEQAMEPCRVESQYLVTIFIALNLSHESARQRQKKN